MFAASKSGSSAAPKDPQFNYVTMLLHGDGTNGAQNNTFLDASANNFTITRNGNTTQGTFTPYGSNWSNYFAGGSNYLDFPSNAAYGMGTGDFTIEAWLYPTAAWAGAGSYNPIFLVNGTGGLYFGQNSAGFGLRQSGTANIISYGTSPSLNTWTHVAIVRSGTTVTMYYNGTSVATATSSANFTSGTLTIGYDGSYGIPAQYISNLRIVKGTAVYTGAFTPSTTPLTAVSGTSLLTCQGNRFIDVSSNAATITITGAPTIQRFSPFSPTSAYSTSVIGGSGYYDGSGDYLRVAYNSNLYPTSSGTDYTVECWLYPTAGTTGLQYILGTNNLSVADWGFTQDSGQWGFTLSGTGGNAGTVIANQWTHLAMTRNGSTVNGYVNGVRVLSVSSSTQSNNSLPINIGMRNGSDRAFTGYITDIRIVNGTAVYTGTSYTVPTAPVTAVTNTQLLMSNTNAGIFDNAEMVDLETVGNAQISTSVKKYGTGSMYFDGTGDYLVTPATNLPLTFGTGDFTIECWIYPTTVSGGAITIISNRYDAGADTVLFFGFGTTYGLFCHTQATQVINSGTNATANTWQHVALCRSSGTIKIFLNGTQIGSSASSSQNLSSTVPVYVGQDGTKTGGASAQYTGYIDDLRITKGYARYTANFTAPTMAFPNQ